MGRIRRLVSAKVLAQEPAPPIVEPTAKLLIDIKDWCDFRFYESCMLNSIFDSELHEKNKSALVRQATYVLYDAIRQFRLGPNFDVVTHLRSYKVSDVGLFWKYGVQDAVYYLGDREMWVVANIER